MKKSVKDKVNNIKEETLKLMGIYFIVVLITFITVILVYFIGLYRYNRSNNFKMNLFQIKAKVTDSDYELITLDEEVELKDKCENGCKIKIGTSSSYKYYEIVKDEDSYILNINLLYKPIGQYNIGNDISTLKLRKFLEYDMLTLIVKSTVRLYDEAIVINNETADVFVSSDKEEMEFTDSSIIYYTYSCYSSEGTNAVKFKNERKPFNETGEIISYNLLNLNIC